MADSSSDESGYDPHWVLYKDRPDWKDVIPLPQDDGPNPVVRIAYSDRFRDTFDYLRAVMKSDERSERTFLLTKEAVLLNPANYSAWHYRRNILKDLDKNLREELLFCSSTIENNPKNYQVWHHRKMLVEWLSDPSEELKFTEGILQLDSKNYHAWQHRQWVIKQFNLYDQELKYIDELLEEDVRNNSAWNQRYFVISNTTNYSPDVLESELKYSIEKIRLVHHNESPWNYLKGVLFLQDIDPFTYENVWEFCEEIYSSNVRSPYLLSFMIDCIEEHLEQKGAKGSEDLVEKALSLAQSLADSHDTIRKEYWKFTHQKIFDFYGAKAC